MTESLSKALEEDTDIKLAAYVVAAKSTTASLHKASMMASDNELAAICGKVKKLKKERFKMTALCGAWLTTLPDSQNGTDLDRENFWNTLPIRYFFCLLGLPAQ